MEILSKFPLFEPVLVVLWPSISVTLMIGNTTGSVSGPGMNVPALLFVKTMLFLHVTRNVNDADSIHNEKTVKFPSVGFPLVPLRALCDTLGSRHHHRRRKFPKENMNMIRKTSPEYTGRSRFQVSCWQRCRGIQASWCGFLVKSRLRLRPCGEPLLLMHGSRYLSWMGP